MTLKNVEKTEESFGLRGTTTLTTTKHAARGKVKREGLEYP